MSDARAYAVFGVSLTDPSKYGSRIFADLSANGYRVYAVNPKGGELAGRPVYKNLAEVPEKVYGAILVVPPSAASGAVEQCIAQGVREIWFQPGTRDPHALQTAEAAGIRAVESCFMVQNGIW